MTAHGPALIAKAAQAICDEFDPASQVDWAEQHARAALNAVADDLRAGALEEAADEADGIDGWIDPAGWLRDQAAEIRAGVA